jgi:hypothetical protein
MKLSQLKTILSQLNKVEFRFENGMPIPKHFHVTEIGSTIKTFMDCGGTCREEKLITFQFWYANDFDHRLSASKLIEIIKLSEEKLGLEDLEIEVEYQQETVGRYGLDYTEGKFVLTPTLTDCLAKDKCGVPEPVTTVTTSCCDPQSGCC